VTSALRGQVYDIGYRRYEGQREGRARARSAIFKDGVRAAMGIGRGGRAKILPWLFIGAAVITGVVMALIAGAADRFGGEGTSEQLNLPSHSDFYGFASIILFLFAATVGPELLCPDRRSGVISLYLVRPLTGADYLGARWTSFLTIMTLVAWLPQVVLFAGLSLGAQDSGDYIKDNWLDIPKFLVSGLALSLYATTLALLVASFTTRRAYAGAFLVGLFVISTPFTAGAAEELGGVLGQVISLFNLSNIPVHVNDIIFGEASDVTANAPARELPEYVRLLWWALWTAGPGVILWRRYRRLSP
jgi:ABC-2 type transport system permease protein